MHTYRDTNPTTGMTVMITGDSPLTEQKLNEIFGKAPQQKK